MSVRNRLTGSKTLLGKKVLYVGKTSNSGIAASSSFYTSDHQGREQLSDSSPHPYLTGGGFQVLRTGVKSWPALVDLEYISHGTNLNTYRGLIQESSFSNYTTASALPSPILPSSLLAEGVKGWNRYKPTSRSGSLAQAIFELDDVPRMIKTQLLTKDLARRSKDLVRMSKAGLIHSDTFRSDIRRYIRHGASDYLNYSFGWVPFLNDVRDLIRNAVHMEKRMDQLIRDNNQWVRRRGTVDQTETTSSSRSVGHFTWPALDDPFYLNSIGTNEVRQQTIKTATRYWFSGKFRYNIIPVGAGRLNKYFAIEHMTRILYGTDLSPSLVWQLIPWSWLVDWFSSAGSSLANLFEDSSDNLVAQYAFTMGSTITTDERVVQGHWFNGQEYYTRSCRFTEVKSRLAATPYGFYLTPPALTAKQLSILAALGFTHGALGKI